MTLHLYCEDDCGDIVEVPDRLRSDTLEVQLRAAEGSVGESVIVLDDPDGDFYISGHKPLYLVETDAITDEWFGIIGVFFAWNRVFRRGPARTGAGREVALTVKDINTLLTRRLQKGTDAKRPQESDVERMQWLVDTAEVSGSTYDIEDTDFLFTDTPVQVDATDYTGQDSAGVINDLLQDSGKNAYLYNSPLDGQPIRVGIWFGRTEREDFSSPHRISNVLSDINTDPALMALELPDDLIGGEWTFAPSIDTELDRDPSRVASGVMVQFDGGYWYGQRAATVDEFDRRDMLMQAELVKTMGQAERRGRRYLRDLKEEDDAITTAVIVPNALVNAFKEGHRVQVRFSHLPGYETDFVWMRVAARTIRQISADSGLYEIALDLRGEAPPEASVGSSVYGILHQGGTNIGGTGGALHWQFSGGDADILTHGYPVQPTVGLIDERVDNATAWPYEGWDIDGTGTVNVTMFATVTGVIFAGNSHTITWSILKNGAAVVSESVVVSSAGNTYLGFLPIFGGGPGQPGFDFPVLSISDLSVAPGDVISGKVTCSPPMDFFGAPTGTGQYGDRLEITGGSLA